MSDFDDQEVEVQENESPVGEAEAVDTEPAPQEAPEQEESSGINPNWNPLLEQLPTGFHKGVTPILQEWDQNYKNLQESVSPYKEFLDEKADPELMRAGMVLAQQLQSDPEGLFNLLNDNFNFVDFIDDDDEDDYNAEDDEDFDYDDEELDEESKALLENPVFLELAGQLEAIQEANEASKVEAEREQAMNTIQSDLQDITDRLGRPITDEEFEVLKGSALGTFEGSLSQAANLLFKSGIWKEKQAPETFNGNGLPQQPREKLLGDNDEDAIVKLLAANGFSN